MSEYLSAAQIGMPQLATFASPGSLVESGVSAARGLASAVDPFPHLGLAMRFKVEVTDLEAGVSLGNWTSCEGLRVEFKYEAIRSGGDYASTHFLPSHVAYGQVTLRRAVETQYSRQIKNWLALFATQWESAEGEPTLGTTVTISLFDVYQDPIAPAAQWQLQNAFPVSWTGPSMNAKSSEIASETLVLEHSGFLDDPA
ncbi:MAG TPA: phage tail protein [Streptosporangiaceae bacterium]|nr:phage tail protein [Streptosporangiaceae bacterium]